ncbi:MAG: SusC/RagA family TonB-linked outer membrane protein [Bacteroidales bacterium]|nr:SusC/RagA family TonB-linked outer membrane protein [Bacteroidales bacterium]
MRKSLRLFFLLLFCLMVNTVTAQVISLKGTVTSAEDNSPLPGVTVQIKGQTKGTITDFNGNYSLQVDADASLVFSYVGYEAMTVPIQGKLVLDVILKPDAQLLGEVVITAMGIQRQKRELGYATDEVGGDVLARSGAGNVINALSGRSAGVQIINPTGVEGGSSRITIRGNNSITGNNQPLIVVDGVPMSNEGGITSFESASRDWGTALNNINQEDIEDISILKGPTAAALYGSRGGNGVLLITTKKGKKQEGLGITVSSSYKITTPYLYRTVQNKYGGGGPISFNTPTLIQNEDGVYSYLLSCPYNSENGPEGVSTNTTFGYYGSSVSWGPEMDGTEILWWDGVMRSYSPQPDNLSMMYHSANSFINNISFSNAGEFGSIRVSFTDNRSDAIIDNCNLKQTTFNVNSTLNVSKKIKADIALTYLDYYRLNSPEIGESYSNFNKGLLYGWPRSYKGLDYYTYANEDGSMYDWGALNYSSVFPYMYSTTFWSFYNNNTTLDRNKVFGSARLLYDVTDWLSVVGKVGIDFGLDQSRSKNKPTESDGVSGGSVSSRLSKNYTLDADFLVTLHQEKIFGSKLNFRLSGGAETLYRNDYNLYAGSGSNWIYPYLYTITNYSEYINSSAATESFYEKKVNSVYGFLFLGYDNFLFLDITGRNDWSSTLPSSNNSYFYPSATVSFIPTEVFHGNWGPVSFLKFRGSVAMTASDDEPYKLDFTYNNGSFGGQPSSFAAFLSPAIRIKTSTPTLLRSRYEHRV